MWPTKKIRTYPEATVPQCTNNGHLKDQSCPYFEIHIPTDLPDPYDNLPNPEEI